MKIQDVLTDETKWAKGSMAYAADGLSTLPWASASPPPCKFCLMGAVEYACVGDFARANKIYSEIHAWLDENARDRGYKNRVAGWNDDPTRTFAEVRELIEGLDI